MYNMHFYQSRSRDLFDISDRDSPNRFESIYHAMSADTYHSDFVTLMDILNGKSFKYSIPEKTVRNAAKYYKHANKALLVLQHLTDTEKQMASAELDSKASELANEWRRQLHDKNIRII